MVTVFESIMLICFGISWPISVYKSIASGSTKGKSVVFTIAIIVGYIAGITGKIVGGNFNYVLALYILNLAFVSADLVLYFVNRRRERREENSKNAQNGQTAFPAKKHTEKIAIKEI